jgi:hypothetical protein
VAKTWILDSETKGTGAHIAPLGSDRPRADRDLAIVTLERPARALKAPEPSPPRSFKVVDVMSAQVMAEGVGTRETLALLAGMKTMIDARIYAWVPGAERWRLLRLEEQRALWALRDSGTPDGSDTPPEG